MIYSEEIQFHFFRTQNTYAELEKVNNKIYLYLQLYFGLLRKGIKIVVISFIKL